ncbi:DUF418 domain-containing protein [Aestuariibacter salexigens]|uniref:DUF418 domain-containing protein n=1 Tax=Aestuariibacter salexigens TaxID=226010 RepID=UPI000403865C|nr:DUF418 domain-containing protein [Aestuariibacter salexigens]
MDIFSKAGPADINERISGLDVARGFALLGILIMNSTGMALYDSAYFNFLSGGGEGAVNFAAWSSMAIYFEGAMRGLFSLLFGAGIVIFLDRMDNKGNSNGIELHGRRMLLLIMFGLINTFVILYPYDILLFYGICGLFLFPLRRLPMKQLLVVFVVLFVASNLFSLNRMANDDKDRKAYNEAVAHQQAGNELDSTQQKSVEKWQKKLDKWTGTDEAREKDNWVNEANVIKFSQQSWSKYADRFSDVGFYRFLFDCLFMVTLGIILARTGVLTGKAANATYVYLLLIGYGVGISLGVLRSVVLYTSDFSYDALGHLNSTYQLRRIALSLGHVGLIFCLVRFGLLKGLQTVFSALGRMAFTNYLVQSVFQVFIWYGPGLSLHGKVDRYEVWIAIAAIWVCQAIFSMWWLNKYRFGPLEWLWRSMTYGSLSSNKLVSQPA